MTDLRKHSHTMIKTMPFVSMLFFMTGTMLVAADEFYCNKYLRVLGIIPVCIALIMPYCTNWLKNYSKLILRLLCILAYSECVTPDEGFFIPYANKVMLNELFDFSNPYMVTVINAIPVFASFVCTFLNMKYKKIAVWTLLLWNLAAVIFVLIKNSLWINIYDYYFSDSYIILLLSVLIGFDFCQEEKSNAA